MNEIDGVACGTAGCDNRGHPGLNLVGYGSFATKSGRRRRYQCTVCRGTLSTNTGTAYSGLRCTRRKFDHVASLRVEGVSISATARVTGHSRNTVARWLERASTAARRFNYRMLRDFDLIELQADELCTFVGKKSQTCWLFATIEVSSRLWAGSVLGHRSDRNARAVISDVIRRGRVVGCPLIATDGFEYYVGAVEGLFGSTCVYGQVLKTRRNNRVVRVERRVKMGTATRLKAALWESEDSETLNTSFVERLNLTIRQGSAYLRRRSPCHARGADQLRSHVELVRCHDNFVRPHRALRFGRETRTPAMQAGLVSTRLALSDIFTARRVTLRVLVAVVEACGAELLTLSWSHRQRTAASSTASSASTRIRATRPGGRMPRKRYSTEQIVTKLRQAEVELGRGLRTPQVCKKLDISEQTYYRWRREYGGLRLDQAKRLKTLEQENVRLKKLVADQALDNAILKEVASGNC